jgi:hypothetical protein
MSLKYTLPTNPAVWAKVVGTAAAASDVVYSVQFNALPDDNVAAAFLHRNGHFLTQCHALELIGKQIQGFATYYNNLILNNPGDFPQ